MSSEHHEPWAAAGVLARLMPASIAHANTILIAASLKIDRSFS
jgi:hypothetical protein